LGDARLWHFLCPKVPPLGTLVRIQQTTGKSEPTLGQVAAILGCPPIARRANTYGGLSARRPAATVLVAGLFAHASAGFGDDASAELRGDAADAADGVQRAGEPGGWPPPLVKGRSAGTYPTARGPSLGCGRPSGGCSLAPLRFARPQPGALPTGRGSPSRSARCAPLTIHPCCPDGRCG